MAGLKFDVTGEETPIHKQPELGLIVPRGCIIPRFRQVDAGRYRKETLLRNAREGSGFTSSGS